MTYKREGIIANGTNKQMVRIRQMLYIRFIRSFGSYSRYFHFAKTDSEIATTLQERQGLNKNLGVLQ
jgi:hypothetical protein